MIPNRILRALAALRPHAVVERAERIRLSADQVIGCYGEAPCSVYFPASAVVSHAVRLGGRTALMDLVGREGVVGERVVRGNARSEGDTVVTVTGTAWRLPLGIVQETYAADPTARLVFDRYAEYRLAEAAITAACSALHPLDRQLCRILLMLAERTGDQIAITHRQLAVMAGTTRPSVTRNLSALAAAGIVRQSPGTLIIVDGAGLLTRACSCYRRIREELERVYAGLPP